MENINVLSWGEKADLLVGSFCSIARGCTAILGGNHRTDWITTYPFGNIHQNELYGYKSGVSSELSQTNGSITIGNDVWIGLNVTIMSGVYIADGGIDSSK